MLGSKRQFRLDRAEVLLLSLPAQTSGLPVLDHPLLFLPVSDLLLRLQVRWHRHNAPPGSPDLPSLHLEVLHLGVVRVGLVGGDHLRDTSSTLDHPGHF